MLKMMRKDVSRFERLRVGRYEERVTCSLLYFMKIQGFYTKIILTKGEMIRKARIKHMKWIGG
jgi:hypothetical protein